MQAQRDTRRRARHRMHGGTAGAGRLWSEGVSPSPWGMRQRCHLPPALSSHTFTTPGTFFCEQHTIQGAINLTLAEWLPLRVVATLRQQPVGVLLSENLRVETGCPPEPPDIVPASVTSPVHPLKTHGQIPGCPFQNLIGLNLLSKDSTARRMTRSEAQDSRSRAARLGTAAPEGGRLQPSREKRGLCPCYGGGKLGRSPLPSSAVVSVDGADADTEKQPPKAH